MILGNDEEKRSQLWRVVVVVASLVIVITTAVFLYGMFTKSPIEGVWRNSTQTLTLNIKDEDVVEVEIKTAQESKQAVLSYTLDTDDKTIAFSNTGSADVEILSVMNTLEEMAGFYNMTYGYSMNQGVLTLTDRESGDLYLFEKVQK